MSKEITKKADAEVVASGAGTIGTISGIEPGDINMPYVFVVQNNTKNAVLDNGKKAEPGTLFHNTKRFTYSELDVLVAFAKKGTAIKKDMSTGDETEVPAYRAVMLPLENLHSPFIMTFKQMNLWYGWKPYISKLSASGLTNLDNVVRLTTKEMETSYGSTVYVVNMEIADEVTKAQREVINGVLERFGGVLDRVVDDEDVEDEETQNMDVDDLLKELDES